MLFEAVQNNGLRTIKESSDSVMKEGKSGERQLDQLAASAGRHHHCQRQHSAELAVGISVQLQQWPLRSTGLRLILVSRVRKSDWSQVCSDMPLSSLPLSCEGNVLTG